MGFYFSRVFAWLSFTALLLTSTASYGQSLLASLNGVDFAMKANGTAVGTTWVLTTNGSILTQINFPNTVVYEFNIRAYGTSAKSVFPVMELRINSVNLILRASVTSNTSAVYKATTMLPAGTHNVEIAFTNDLRTRREDRNLYVAHLDVISSAAPTPTPVPAPAPAPAPAPSPTPTVSTPDFTKLKPSCYVPRANPIIRQDNFFAGAEWNDPHILKVGSQYVMYASADTYWSQDIKIYRLLSNDGINWALNPSTPVFTKSSTATAWDAKSVETPGVVYFKGKYYLFYTAYSTTLSDSSSYKIGYATSVDGINFTRASSTYLLAPTNPGGAVTLDFKQFVVGEPGPVVFNDKIYLYFTAIGGDAATGTMLQTVGVVTSADGVSWTAPQQVLKPNQAIYPRAAGWIGYSTPHAAAFDGKVHLYFDVVNEIPAWKQLKIHHAVSNDGLTGFVQDSTAIFDYTQFSWTTEEIRSPAVLLDGKSLKLYFAGHNSTAVPASFIYGIGYSECAL